MEISVNFSFFSSFKTRLLRLCGSARHLSQSESDNTLLFLERRIKAKVLSFLRECRQHHTSSLIFLYSTLLSTLYTLLRTVLAFVKMRMP